MTPFLCVWGVIMSERELNESSDALGMTVGATLVLALSPVIFKAGLDARCYVPEDIGGQIAAKLVFIISGTGAGQVVAFSICGRDEKVRQEIILHSLFNP